MSDISVSQSKKANSLGRLFASVIAAWESDPVGAYLHTLSRGCPPAGTVDL